MWWTLLATAWAIPVAPCSEPDPSGAVYETTHGVATAITPDGYLVTTMWGAGAERGQKPPTETGAWVGDELREATIVDWDRGVVLLFVKDLPPACGVFGIHGGQELAEASQDGTPIWDEDEVVALQDSDGSVKPLHDGVAFELDLDYREPESTTDWFLLEVVGGLIFVVAGVYWIFATQLVSGWGRTKSISGTTSAPRRACPGVWVEQAERLGLEVGEGLSGTIDGLAVQILYEGGGTTVLVRCSPTDLQIRHAGGRVRDPLDLDNPVADSLIAVGGDPAWVERFQDEAFLGAVLAVVHAHPESVVDSEGVTVRTSGLQGNLDALLEPALDLARRLGPGVG